MALNLPEKDYLTPAELANRWSKSEAYVMHLLETGKLPAADRNAAVNGKRRTFYFLQGEPSHHHLPQLFPGEVSRLYREDEDILVFSFHDGDPMTAAEIAFDETPGAKDIVILMGDIEEFEAAHTTPGPANVLEVKGPLMDATREAVIAFPSQYPEFKSRPPKIKDDLIPWLQESRRASSKNDAEKIARLVAEHFDLPGATRNT